MIYIFHVDIYDEDTNVLAFLPLSTFKGHTDKVGKMCVTACFMEMLLCPISSF